MTQVHVLSFSPAKANCGIVVGSHRSLLIDAGPGRAAATELMRTAERLGEGDPHPIDLVLTHDHWDHFFGASTAVEMGVAHVYASASFAADQEATAWIALDAVSRGEIPTEYREQLPADPADLIVDVSPIDPTPGTVGHLDLGGCPVEFHVLGGHSTADVVVRLPELGIVFVGDLVEEGDPPQAGTDSSLGEWVAALRTILDFAEARTFVPGHGVPVDRGFVQRQLTDLEGLRAEQGDAEAVLPARTAPGQPERRIPRALRLL